MNDEIQVGDWVMSRPAPGHESLFHKGILMTGAKHCHDEIVGEVPAGYLVTANARWPHFVLTPWQERINTGINIMGELAIPYDRLAIVSHALNYLLKRAGISWQREYQVFCTESAWILYRATGIDLDPFTGFQPLVSPIHAERLVKASLLVLVKDYGLMKYMNRK